jgi:hypothetical protein
MSKAISLKLEIYHTKNLFKGAPVEQDEHQKLRIKASLLLYQLTGEIFFKTEVGELSFTGATKEGLRKKTLKLRSLTAGSKKHLEIIYHLKTQVYEMDQANEKSLVLDPLELLWKVFKHETLPQDLLLFTGKEKISLEVKRESPDSLKVLSSLGVLSHNQSDDFILLKPNKFPKIKIYRI